jgi:hypothetical protein
MSANTRQVGGAHYKSEYQHWDFAVDADLGPFEYQITKYGTRHRGKAGRQDLEKSAHFADKLIELANEGYLPHHRRVTGALLTCYVQANALDTREAELMRLVCGWTKLAHLLAVRQHLREMLEHYYPATFVPPDIGDEASADYVDQDGAAARAHYQDGRDLKTCTVCARGEVIGGKCDRCSHPAPDHPHYGGTGAGY